MGAPGSIAEPEPTARRVQVEFTAGPRSSARVRRALARFGLPSQLEADAQLLASELFSNSVLHAGLGHDGVVTVTMEWSGERLRVTVDDGKQNARLPVSAIIRPGPGAEAGWGLYLVDRLADRWGVGQRGYWFELRRGRYERDP